jgi:pimeloyl-ACP methyl ester carboxylesterase
MSRILALLGLGLTLLASSLVWAAEPYGIGLEGFAYPYPVSMLSLSGEGEMLRLAYMDVKPTAQANGRAVLLLHGRNFPSSYWEPTIKALAAAGYRVVVPDQVGFGKSSKPLAQVSFDSMARHTLALLDNLQLPRVDIVAHSMGGMLAVRFARAYPDRLDRLVLAAPIGLEDYRNFVPPVDTERIVADEDKLTADGYRRQLVTNYSLTLPPDDITPFVEARMRIKDAADYPRWLRAFVNSFQTIWGQPVVYEIPLLTQPTLFIMGGNDHNAPGRAYAPESVRAKMGDNARLARELAPRMKDGKVIVFDGIGHLVQLEAKDRFNAAVLSFLNNGR